MITKKGQNLSMDMILSIIVFLLIISLVITIIFFSNIYKKETQYDFELDYIFENLQVNIDSTNPAMSFINGSRIDADKLKLFANEYSSNSIDEIMLGNTSTTQGIGLDEQGYDVCFYFTDNKMNPVEMISGVNYLGTVSYNNNEKTCQYMIEDDLNPCTDYKNAVSFMRPVLLDLKDRTKNRIVQMNAVVCVK